MRWTAAALWGLLAVGCGPKGDEPRPTGSLVLHFEHRIGDEALALSTPFTTRYGQEVVFDHLRYWVSNVTVGAGEVDEVVPASYFLVEQTPERARLTVEVPGVPEGTWERVALHIGVDPVRNASLDAMAGELAPGIGMDWGWDTGYKFLRAEGSFEERGIAGEFAIHTGNDVLYKRLSADLPAEITVVAGDPVELTLTAEVDRLFAGVELSKGSEILGGTVDSTAGKIAGNYARMFSLVAPGGRVPLVATSPNLASPDNGDIPTDGTPPELTHAVVGGGDIFCDEVPGRGAGEERSCVTPFLHGSGGAAYEAGLFTFVTDNGASVVASAPGVVSDVVMLDHSPLTHSDLFLVAVRPNDDSAFWLEYRNVKDLQVAKGDAVEAGQVLGGAGDYHDPSVGLVAFSVRRQQEVVQRLCPTRYATPELTGTYEALLGDAAAAWPEYPHDALCAAPSLVCGGGACEAPSDFEVAHGDVDAGRRIYATTCASCHGAEGEGGVAGPLCSGPDCACTDCTDHATLAARIHQDMPPEGYCNLECAADVAAFLLYAFRAE